MRTRRISFRKTWLLQAMKRPEAVSPGLMITNGMGRLFVQTLLPRDPEVTFCHGQGLYSCGGGAYLPQRDTGPAPECRIEISPREAAQTDYFLHVLTATDVSTDSVPAATMEETDVEFRVRAGKATISFDKNNVGGSVEIAGRRRQFTDEVQEENSWDSTK